MKIIFTPEYILIDLVVNFFLIIQIPIHGCVLYILIAFYSKPFFSKQFLKLYDSFVNKST